MSKLRIIQGDCVEWLRECDRYDMIFADPPDNIGLKYGEYVDKIPDLQYYGMLENIMHLAVMKCRVFWLSYYWRHDIEIKRRAWSITKGRLWNAKTFIWRFTFGQHTHSDCGSGFRFLLRLASPGWTPDTTGIRIPSVRQAIGDKRADSRGRVPDDVWEFDADSVWDEYPRIVGNSPERREWHPTQHPEGLIERVFRLSGGRRYLDCFAGTGTCLRVAKKLGVDCDAIEIDAGYAGRISTDVGVDLVRFPGSPEK